MVTYEHELTHHTIIVPSSCAGAKLDVWLAQRHGYENVHVSRSLVLQRYHGSVSVLDTLVYRLRLLRVRASFENLVRPIMCSTYTLGVVCATCYVDQPVSRLLMAF